MKPVIREILSSVADINVDGTTAAGRLD